MNLARIHMRFYVSDYRKPMKQVQTLIAEGYSGRTGIRLPTFREKKIGTSVLAKTTSFYSAFLSPPPICPMVEKNPFFEIPEVKSSVHNSIKECA